MGYPRLTFDFKRRRYFNQCRVVSDSKALDFPRKLHKQEITQGLCWSWLMFHLSKCAELLPGKYRLDSVGRVSSPTPTPPLQREPIVLAGRAPNHLWREWLEPRTYPGGSFWRQSGKERRNSSQMPPGGLVLGGVGVDCLPGKPDRHLMMAMTTMLFVLSEFFSASLFRP